MPPGLAEVPDVPDVPDRCPPPLSRPSRRRRRVRLPFRFRSRPRRRIGLRLATVVAALVLAASGAGHAVVQRVDEQVERVDPFGGLAESGRPEDGRGTNILLIGTDSRDGLSAEQRRAYHLGDSSCYCADAVVLLHLSGESGRASVVSLPRDSYTRLPEHTFAGTGEHHDAHPDKLNAALTHGGPTLMVRTVEDMTGLRIDHYIEVDFASFVRAVDEVGGVAVCTPQPLHDAYSGLDLPAGTSVLDGATALAYVRARHVDGSSDFGRMKRQREFLAAFLDRLASGDVLLSPERLAGTARALLGSVRADEGLGPQEILALAGALRDLSPSGTEFAAVPVADSGREVPGLGETVLWDVPEADRIFDALREDRPLGELAEKPAQPPSQKGNDADKSGENPCQ
ncbi:LCP family protein [Streptomyces sp. 7-21]|uniref:LCP family protein n=1 Tax=Streptomyces sp. 7-21 TaxID=2802283 RepID=UPI00191E97C1|nr:LCP family protein [Streptomyces sp. 7-21]MBL1066255.1 LCP family protein [Streptomyces sp. 7-21]